MPRNGTWGTSATYLLLKQIPQLALILLAPAPQRAALESGPLAQERADVDVQAFEGRAAHGAKLDDAAVEVEDVEVGLEVGRADVVDY